MIVRWLTYLNPSAIAYISGNDENPQISGNCSFYETNMGVFVVSSLIGLPYSDQPCGGRIFAMHIHDGIGCIAHPQTGYTDIGFHYNPGNCQHPYHSGDMVPLFSITAGYALSAFLTNRFTVDEVIGRPVFVHERQDDFTSQPSGNAGKAMACGVILKTVI